MPDVLHSPEDLQRIYHARFAGKSAYRQRVWGVLCSFFSRWIPPEGSVLDLGSGHCEFINNISSRRKAAMDLNPDTKKFANANVQVLQQDCSQPWELAPASLDAVFTSNFFEHLPDKAALERTLQEVRRALKPGGRLIAMGPNIKFVPGQYWDFFDHYLPLTELALVEVLQKSGFEIEQAWARFLPYSMSAGPQYPTWTLRMFLANRWAWRIFGKQFLVVARK